MGHDRIQPRPYSSPTGRGILILTLVLVGCSPSPRRATVPGAQDSFPKPDAPATSDTLRPSNADTADSDVTDTLASQADRPCFASYIGLHCRE
jgi:hypothetical protein